MYRQLGRGHCGKRELFDIKIWMIQIFLYIYCKVENSSMVSISNEFPSKIYSQVEQFHQYTLFHNPFAYIFEHVIKGQVVLL